MRPDDPNCEYLLLIADALGDLRNNLVFVGGCTAGLLLTDSAVEGIRATKDVDAIVEAASLRQYTSWRAVCQLWAFRGTRIAT